MAEYAGRGDPRVILPLLWGRTTPAARGSRSRTTGPLSCGCWCRPWTRAVIAPPTSGLGVGVTVATSAPSSTWKLASKFSQPVICLGV